MQLVVQTGNSGTRGVLVCTKLVQELVSMLTSADTSAHNIQIMSKLLFLHFLMLISEFFLMFSTKITSILSIPIAMLLTYTGFME